ncbi:MAG: hypothetical protein NFCOHLIN_02271 [Gammaproteobacteria bacterium]|nr:hypothetical protein [Gammaproteobacteria bacterium]
MTDTPSTTRVRTSIADGICTVRAMMRHVMETGNRRDKLTGALIPAHHITEVACEHNGRVVMSCAWGTGIARNPLLSFRFRGARPGDVLTLRWVDNRGATDVTHVTIE